MGAAFPPLGTEAFEAEIERASTTDKGHGRIEKRTIEVTSDLAKYLERDWPGCEQVFRLTRERKIKGKVTIEVVYGITSLSRDQATPARLPTLTRDHWGIENGLHGVRDVTLHEDASRIRKGSATEVMAALRNIVIFLFKKLGHKGPKEATRHYLCHPEESVNALSTPIRK